MSDGHGGKAASSAFLIALALVAVTACSGGDGGTAIEATAREWQLGPNVWTVPEGTSVDLDFTNAGSMSHEWTLLDTTTVSESDFDPASVVFTTGIVGPGDRMNGSFPAPPPGTYTVGCFIPGHFDLGMVGTLTVTATS
jgi:uncharacterized cupredoxin-like copper-binding protein